MKLNDYNEEMIKINAEALNTFSKLTNDNNSIHTRFNRKTNNKPIAHGAYIISLATGIIGTKFPGDGSMILSIDFKFKNPIYEGSTIKIHLTCTNKITSEIFNLSVMVFVADKLCVSGNALVRQG